MRKVIILMAVIVYSISIFSQEECGYTLCQRESNPDISIGYIGNGGAFTPHGDYRILVIFVVLESPYDTLPIDDWPVGAKYPNWANDSNAKPFYSDFNEFNQSIYADTNRFSLSNFYYQMSKGALRIVADYYPDTVRVNVRSNDSWGKLNRRAALRIPNNFDWSKYDNHVNNPDYKSDNSSYNPDGNVDYVVFCYRFSWDWGIVEGMLGNGHGANGFSLTDIYGSGLPVGSGYYIKNQGFTLMTGYTVPMIIFPHEMGHELYRGPHYNGGNGVTGNHFYMPTAGWGMMNIDHGYTCALGWERYVLDWVSQISANGVPADLDEVADLAATNGLYTLRDFITTGDAIRIRVLDDSGKYQYLWLENHQGISTFDGSIHGGLFCGDSIEEYKRGLVAYVEEYSHVKEEDTIKTLTIGNGVRWLSRNGDYDFTYTPTQIHPGVICKKTTTYPMDIHKANPIGGQSVNEYIRQDYNNDYNIGYNPLYAYASNEGTWVVKLENEDTTARWITGTGMQFHGGDKVGIATNPTIKNMPEYNQTTCKMGDYYLNGISFEVLSENADGSITVKIRLDDVAVDRDVRWAAASIALTNITGDSLPDVDVRPNITLTIDRSGTPNRHVNPANPNPTTPDVNNFITPTTFTCRSGSYFKQEPYSTVRVQMCSSLVIDSGAVYEVGDHAMLEITTKSTLLVRRGATLRVLGTGHVEICDRANICIEDGAYIHLVDTLSAVNLMPLSASGINSQSSAPAGDCTNTNLVNFQLAADSHGAIRRFGSNAKYIQNKIYTNKDYIFGKAIYAGNHVIPIQAIPSGDVVVKNGSHVIWDAANGVHLEPGTRVEAGGVLEVR